MNVLFFLKPKDEVEFIKNRFIQEELILKSFASMIRYCCNNLEGNFIFSRAASALGITDEIVEILLEMFQEAGMIKILDRAENSYKIEFVSGIELSKTLHSIKYAEFVELMNTINDYKNKFMKIELL